MKLLHFPEEGGDPVVAVSTCPVVPSAKIEGIPVVPVMSTPLSAVDRPATTFADEEYNIWLTVVVAG